MCGDVNSQYATSCHGEDETCSELEKLKKTEGSADSTYDAIVRDLHPGRDGAQREMELYASPKVSWRKRSCYGAKDGDEDNERRILP